MSTFTRNQTFTNGEQVFPEDLHALVESTTLNAAVVLNEHIALNAAKTNKFAANAVDNTKLAPVPAYTLKAKLSGRTGVVTDEAFIDVANALDLPQVPMTSDLDLVSGIIPIDEAASPYVGMIGIAAITGFAALAAGVKRTICFKTSITLTHNATSFILPGAQNIPTLAGDTAEFISEGGGNWRCLWYMCKITLENGDAETAYRGFDFAYSIVTSHGGGFFTSPNLPAGLSLSRSTGIITGRATTAGVYTVDIYQTLSLVKAHAQVTITVVPGITNQSASGNAGFAFSYQLTANVVPTTWAVSSLPTGLSVNSSTGLISGTPTSALVGNETITVSNSHGSDTATLSLNVTLLRVKFVGNPNSAGYDSYQVSIDGGAAFTPTFSSYYSTTWYYIRSKYSVGGAKTLASAHGLLPTFGETMIFDQSGYSSVRARGAYLLNWPNNFTAVPGVNSVAIGLATDDGYAVYAGQTQSDTSFGSNFDMSGISLDHHNIQVVATVECYSSGAPQAPTGTVFQYNAEFDFS